MRKIIKYTDPKVLGVTGGIGSGQSTVCRFLNERGCKIIDVDIKAKNIIQNDKSLQKELKKTFGNNIFSAGGELNRRLLANLVFHDEAKTLQLNKLVHPRMVPVIIEEMESARFSQKYPLIIVDAALIYEISIEQLFDIIIVVYTSQEKRIKRVMERDKMTRQEIQARVRRQIALEDKRAWADYVIDNNGSIEDLKKQTNKLFETLVSDLQTDRRIRV